MVHVKIPEIPVAIAAVAGATWATWAGGTKAAEGEASAAVVAVGTGAAEEAIHPEHRLVHFRRRRRGHGAPDSCFGLVWF